jgi:putative heme-binding domain-containing protein
MSRGPIVACIALAVWGAEPLTDGHGARADDVIPHAQDKPPGPPLSPAEAMGKMTVPPGFRVELVAAEPDVVNPVAMTFDERGRVWITESLEYPRQQAGPGRDRIKVLEDTDADGRADRFTIFAEGFNIPSGIAVGYGGVWVANAPDILLLQDTDGDGRADKQEVVVTGFGRDDTHELPNSLTWGPDGWLYGLNGVFNPSTVVQDGKKHEFTCALFRIHPRTREFQIFAEGTSNPWGVAWDGEGSAFVSACVIDHLWHLAETGYYVRQGGPYPPFVKPMGSIVAHKHQKAAYCGIHYFDSDAYPPEYRGRLYMGNIHGNCINVDTLRRKGATYVGEAAADFLSANDAWFMPVVQKTGPDGCLYVLDWYDRYHCYQDARRDPGGIDRLKGRLYRVRYESAPRPEPFDLARETDAQLIARLHSPNVFFRDVAQRILAERSDPETRPVLERLVLDPAAPRAARRHALWALVSSGPLSLEFHAALLAHEDSAWRAWGVRAAGNASRVDPTIRQRVVDLASDAAADVRLQVAIAARKIVGLDPIPTLLTVAACSPDDALIEHIVWQNVHPILEQHGERLFQLAAHEQYWQSPRVVELVHRATECVLSRGNPRPILALLDHLHGRPNVDLTTAAKCLNALTAKFQNGELSAGQLAELRPRLEPMADRYRESQPPGSELHDASLLLAATWGDSRAVASVRQMVEARQAHIDRRIQALRALVVADDEMLDEMIERLFARATEYPVELRRAAIASLGHVDAPWVAAHLLDHYDGLEAELRPAAVELLCQRRAWAEPLLERIGQGQVPAAALNANQVRQLLVGADSELAAKIRAHWGSVRDQRDPKREEVIAQMRGFLRTTPGDPLAGQAVFQRVCGQCHKLHGAGEDIGPDITLNGRNSFEQLLSNVFDPSLVIGAAYQARTVVTADGRVLTGLVAEDSPQRVVLKIQGGKVETIARADVEMMQVSALSLMPEDLEKQLKPRELADLFALLTLDKPPTDPGAKKLPGSQPIVPRETSDPDQASELVQEVAFGFSLEKGVTKPRVAIVAEHAGRPGVLRVQPPSWTTRPVLQRTIELPSGKRSRLVVGVSHEAHGGWKLAIEVDGVRALDGVAIGNGEPEPAWRTVSLDLTDLLARRSGPPRNTVQIRLIHTSPKSKGNAAYWSQVEVVSE